ncbi:hypothetical protein RF11_15364 [Thelohanellus kitauei]|uniref:Uncharacterized protein n=1 Tax=Thelohanellus kitauei TaxID=669202 RepID=A0A0C2ITX4_THEKT|nr:hypothetical protein RF11_15364 [Thelohanellus kitauei]
MLRNSPRMFRMFKEPRETIQVYVLLLFNKSDDGHWTLVVTKLVYDGILGRVFDRNNVRFQETLKIRVDTNKKLKTEHQIAELYVSLVSIGVQLTSKMNQVNKLFLFCQGNIPSNGPYSTNGLRTPSYSSTDIDAKYLPREYPSYSRSMENILISYFKNT